jgi:hypothetical protein
VADTYEGLRVSQQAGISEIPRALVELCDIDESSTPQNNRYIHGLKLMASILRFDSDKLSTVFQYFGWAWQSLKPLAVSRDPRGLVLLAFWTCMMRHTRKWWCEQRAHKMCATIVHHLSGLHDARIDALLGFPATSALDSAEMWQILQNLARDQL